MPINRGSNRSSPRSDARATPWASVLPNTEPPSWNFGVLATDGVPPPRSVAASSVDANGRSENAGTDDGEDHWQSGFWCLSRRVGGRTPIGLFGEGAMVGVPGRIPGSHTGGVDRDREQLGRTFAGAPVVGDGIALR